MSGRRSNGSRSVEAGRCTRSLLYLSHSLPPLRGLLIVPLSVLVFLSAFWSIVIGVLLSICRPLSWRVVEKGLYKGSNSRWWRWTTINRSWEPCSRCYCCFVAAESERLANWLRCLLSLQDLLTASVSRRLIFVCDANQENQTGSLKDTSTWQIMISLADTRLFDADQPTACPEDDSPCPQKDCSQLKICCRLKG